MRRACTPCVQAPALLFSVVAPPRSAAAWLSAAASQRGRGPFGPRRRLLDAGMAKANRRICGRLEGLQPAAEPTRFAARLRLIRPRAPIDAQSPFSLPRYPDFSTGSVRVTKMAAVFTTANFIVLDIVALGAKRRVYNIIVWISSKSRSLF